MSVGLHCRLARPGRVAGLADFMDYAKSFGRDVWICTREELAEFWLEHHYPKGAGSVVQTLSSDPMDTKGKSDKKPGEMEDVKL